MTWRYLAYGLSLCSELKLPSAILAPANRDTACDVTIAPGPAILTVPRETRGLFTIGAEGIRITVDDGDLLCTADRIEIAARSGVDVGPLLAALGLPCVMWMRHALVLHASAVILPGCEGAVIFAGHSGAGKSTVLAGLLEAGARIVADDTVSLTFEGRGVMVSGLPARIVFGGDNARAVPPERQVVSAPLAALCLLHERGDAPARFEPLDHAARTLVLVDHRYRVRIPRLLDRIRVILGELAAVAGAIPGFSWRRQEGQVSLTSEEMRLLSALSRPLGGIET
jgi:hypothetical protein